MGDYLQAKALPKTAAFRRFGFLIYRFDPRPRGIPRYPIRLGSPFAASTFMADRLDVGKNDRIQIP